MPGSVQRSSSVFSLQVDKRIRLWSNRASCQQRKNCEGSTLNYLTDVELHPGEQLLSWKLDPKRSQLRRTMKLKFGSKLCLFFDWHDFRRFKRYVAILLHQSDNSTLELSYLVVRLNGTKFIHMSQSSENKEKWSVQFEPESCPFLVEIFLNFGTAIPAEKTVLNCLKNLPNDVKILVKGHELVANASLLSAVSPVFSAMFQNGFIESINRTVKIDDIDPEVFKQLLGFIYGIKPNFENQMAEELLATADKYDIQPLKQECAQVLFDTISKENAIRILYLADIHRVTYLFEQAKAFIIDNWGPEEYYFHENRDWLNGNYCDIVEQINCRIYCQITNF